MRLSTWSSALWVLSCAEQGQNLFLTWLPFLLLNSSLPCIQQHLLLEAIHIIRLGLLPKVLSGSVDQDYIRLTFVSCSGRVCQESKNTFLFSQLLMVLCHGIIFGAITWTPLLHAHSSLADVQWLRDAFWNFPFLWRYLKITKPFLWFFPLSK